MKKILFRGKCSPTTQEINMSKVITVTNKQLEMLQEYIEHLQDVEDPRAEHFPQTMPISVSDSHSLNLYRGGKLFDGVHICCTPDRAVHIRHSLNMLLRDGHSVDVVHDPDD